MAGAPAKPLVRSYTGEERIAANYKSACSQLGQAREGVINLVIRGGAHDVQLQPERACRRANVSRGGLGEDGVVGLMSSAKVVAVGMISCSASSRFGATSTLKVVTPVRLPPVRLKELGDKTQLDGIAGRHENCSKS